MVQVLTKNLAEDKTMTISMMHQPRHVIDCDIDTDEEKLMHS